MAGNFVNTIERQVEVGEEITRLRTNFKKEPKARLNSDRLTDYAEYLNKYFSEFSKNHTHLLEFYDELLDTTYFKTDYFKEISVTERAFKAEIELKCIAIGIPYPIQYMSEVDPNNCEKTDNLNQLKMTDDKHNSAKAFAFPIDIEKAEEKLISVNVLDEDDDNPVNKTVLESKIISSTPQKTRINMDLISKFMSDCTLFEEELDKTEQYLIAGLKTRAMVTKSYLDGDYHGLIELRKEVCAKYQNIEHCKTKFDAIQMRFVLLCERLTERMPQSLSSRNIIEPSTLKLKPIEIREFSGDIKAWPTFSQLFSSLIILCDIQKMQYLKSSVRGDAAKLISNLEITNDNFSLAWQLLNNRYDNKRALCNVLLTYSSMFY